MNISNLYNAVVEPRCADTNYIYNPLDLKNVVFSADVTFCAEHCEPAHKVLWCTVNSHMLGGGVVSFS